MTLLKQFTDWVTASTQTQTRLNPVLAPAVVLFNRDGSYFGDIWRSGVCFSVLIDSTPTNFGPSGCPQFRG